MGKILRFKHPTNLMLSMYYDKELRGEDKRGVTIHLKRCGKCALKLQAMEKVTTLLRRTR